MISGDGGSTLGRADAVETSSLWEELDGAQAVSLFENLLSRAAFSTLLFSSSSVSFFCFFSFSLCSFEINNTYSHSVILIAVS